MKWAIYAVAVLFLAGGATCTTQKPAADNNPPVSQTDNKKTADQNSTGKIEAKSPEAISYTQDVKPFFKTYCVECHGGAKAKAGYNLENFDGLVKGGRKGPAVVPGDPDKSMALRALAGQGKQMPPKSYKNQPKDEDVSQLKAWIAAGAKDDSEKGN
jgi:cytochrome c